MRQARTPNLTPTPPTFPLSYQTINIVSQVQSHTIDMFKQGKNFNGNKNAQLEISLKNCLDRLAKSESKITDLQKKYDEATASLEFLYSRIAEFEKFCGSRTEVLERLQSIEKDCGVTRNRVDMLDNKSRSKNIRIINLKESDGENAEQLRVTVDKIIQHTGAQSSSINAFRVGERRHTTRGSGSLQSRPIIATLNSEQDRNNILRSAHKLKTLQERIYIQDDVCLNTSLERQKQMVEFKKLKTQYQTVYFKGHKLKYKGRKQPQQHQPRSGPSHPQKQLNIHSSEDFPALEHRQQHSPNNNEKKQQNANLNKNTHSGGSVSNPNGNRTHIEANPQHQHGPPVQPLTKQQQTFNNQQQQTNVEQVDPKRKQVDSKQQTSTVSNEEGTGISSASTNAEPLPQLICGSERDSAGSKLVCGEPCSGSQPVGSLSTVDRGDGKSDNTLPGRASPSTRSENGANESVNFSTNELVNKPRRSARINIKTHEYEEQEL